MTIALQILYAQLRDWTSVAVPEFDEYLRSHVLPMHNEYGAALSHKERPLVSWTTAVGAWISIARRTDPGLLLEIHFLNLRQTAGFKDRVPQVLQASMWNSCLCSC